MNPPKAIIFDVFGTLVDWRGSVAAGLAAYGAARGLQADWFALTDSWRGAYAPSMNQVRRGERPWTNLDRLHRESLATLLPAFGVTAPPEDIDALVTLWHRLTAWPDSLAGLTRLKTKFTIASLSNGHVALQIALAKHTGFPWDMIFGADIYRHYKPDAETYLGAAALLGLAPGDVMLTAAHNEDLAAAARHGLRTAFISRPMEYGAPDSRAKPSQPWTYTATSIEDLASQLAA